MAQPGDAPPPPPKPIEPETPPIGDVNVLEVEVGQRGSGKTTEECRRARELSAMWGGAYVIGHSLGPRFPRTLPKEVAGREVTLPIVYHRTLEQLVKGLGAKPGNWHILAPWLPGEGGSAPATGSYDTADDLLRYSIRLSSAVRRRAWEREHRWSFKQWNPNSEMLGIPCTPIIVLIDEGIAVASAAKSPRLSRRDAESDNEQDAWFLRYIYSLRHLHIALLWNLQEATSRSWRVLEAATSINVFRTRHEWSLGAIRATGATEEQLDEIKTLPRYRHVTIRPSDFDDPDVADMAESTEKQQVPTEKP